MREDSVALLPAACHPPACPAACLPFCTVSPKPACRLAANLPGLILPAMQTQLADFLRAVPTGVVILRRIDQVLVPTGPTP